MRSSLPPLPGGLDTRAAATLARASTPHVVVRHADLGGPVTSPGDVARLLAIDKSRIAKTLLLARAPDRLAFGLAVLSVDSRVRFSAAAQALGWKGAALASPDELAARIGQPVHGVSPIGADGLPVIVDSPLLAHPTVLVGSGTVGVEIEIDPRVLIDLTGARCATIGDVRRAVTTRIVT